MQRHLQEQHPERRKERSGLGSADRKQRFKATPIRSSGRRENPDGGAELVFLINKAIVEIIIGEVLSGRKAFLPSSRCRVRKGAGMGRLRTATDAK